MPYTLTKRWSMNYQAGNTPKMIIIHHWGADGQSFAGVVNWLCNPRAEVSAHYVLQANQVCQLVDHKNRAWHCVGKNSVSIGIECRPECTAGDRETLAELISNIWKQHGKLPLYGHKDFNATACPGRYYARIPEIKKRAEEIYNGKTPAKVKLSVDGIIGPLTVTALQAWVGTPQDGFISAQAPGMKPYLPAWYSIEYTDAGGSDCIEELQKYLKKKGYNPGEIDGYLGPKTNRALQDFLRKEGESIPSKYNGTIEANTAKALQRFLNKQ